MSKRRPPCIACGGSGKVMQTPKIVLSGLLPNFGAFGLIRCVRCGGSGREK